MEEEIFEAIIQRMLDAYPDNVDKRPNSILYNRFAPVAAELAQIYIRLIGIRDQSFADTAEGEFLERRVAEHGVNRKKATKAQRRGFFSNSDNEPIDVPINSRFLIDDLYFVVQERLSLGQFRLECETAGTIGNTPTGAMLSIENINGLANAQLTDVLIPGQDDEDQEVFRTRFFDEVNEPSFGGNVADYKKKLNEMAGVGGTKVFPTWRGGGTTKCTIIGSGYSAPSAEFVQQVQNEVDPIGNQGQGLGLAPIGHIVTIAGVTNVINDIVTTLSLSPDTTIAMVQSSVETVINEYLYELRKSWEREEALIVRISQIEARILTIEGIVDVQNTTINNQSTNLSLGSEEIPMLGTVTLNAAA